MKKMTILVAVALCATSAFASKARLKALQSSPHLQDSRDVISREPDQALVHGEFVSIETASVTPGTNGANNAAVAPATTPINAEGGFVRKLSDTSALGAWIGAKNENLANQSLALAGTTQQVQNPLNLYYANKMGDMAWGLGLNYSNFEDKTAKTKASSMGLNASLSSAAGWEAQLGLGLTGEATVSDANKFEQKSPMFLSGGYWMDTMFLYGKYAMGGGKAKGVASGTTTKDLEASQIEIGVVNSHKKDGADFFYGVSYLMTTAKDKVTGGSKTEESSLPVVIGIEADATSWMVLRGSIKQNVLLGSSKTSTDTATSSETSLVDSTVVGAGVGLKLGKFMVDGSLAAANGQSGKFGSDTNFLSDVSLTYAF
tara:strand:+ start:36696 stop:37811 length:1116 start_codon:yes stop_codon:yes gene_type:complete